MDYFTRNAVAEDFIKKHESTYSISTITEKIQTYIDNCMDALGASLYEFLSIKDVTSFKISGPLKDHLIDVLSAGLREVKGADGKLRHKVTIINKSALAKCMDIGAFGVGMPTEDAVFVTKHVVRDNFDDEVYEKLKDILRYNIKHLESKRKKQLERLTKTGDLRSGLFLTTFNQNIFNSAEMEKYFQTVFYYYKEVQPTDAPSLDVRDMVLISFMGLTQQLKAIDEYLVREDFKHTILKNNNL